MPTVTVIHAGRKTAGRVAARVTIGRWPTNGIILEGAEVSRVHAWIGQDEEGWFVADAGSRGGTYLNGKRIVESRRLKTHDIIRVGKATLHFDEVEGDGGETFADIREPRSIGREGISFACDCGAPLWAPPGLEGAQGRCRHCRSPISVPAVPSDVTGQAAEQAGSLHHNNAGAADQPVCGICQWPMGEGMAIHHCPTCGLGFHAECWEQNQGCSAYGCGGEKFAQAAQSEEIAAEPAATGDASISLEHLLLLGSLIGALGAMGTFGATALIALVAGLLRLRRRSTARRPVLYTSLVIAALGLALGVPASYFWWFGGGFR